MKKKEFISLGRQLLSYLPGFVVQDGTLLMEPVGHTLRGILFDSSIDPRRFYAHVFIQPLFVPARHIGLNIGWRIGGGCHTWNADSPRLLEELGTALSREGLPFLSRVQSSRDVADAAAGLNRSRDPYVQQAIAYALARAAEVQQAEEAIVQLLGLLDENVLWQREMADGARILKSELVRDPAAARRLLDAWEAETALHLELEALRQPQINQ